jgi:putative endonuclease
MSTMNHALAINCSLRFMAGHLFTAIRFERLGSWSTVNKFTDHKHINMFNFVYVLLSEKDRKFYIGFTHDLPKRILQHDEGLVQSTKGRGPLKLIFYEAYLDERDATRRENYFKTSKGKRTLRLMLKELLNSESILGKEDKLLP